MTRAFLGGILLGAIFSALVCLGLVRVFDRPSYVDLAGRFFSDTTSHPDSRMNNRLSLLDAELDEPLYITSTAVDINDLYALTDSLVRVRGEFRRLMLNTGESVLEMEVKDVLAATAPK